jgi:hypothetical protein
MRMIVRIGVNWGSWVIATLNGREKEKIILVSQEVVVYGCLIIVLKVSSRKLLIQFTVDCILKYEVMPHIPVLMVGRIKNTPHPTQHCSL